MLPDNGLVPIDLRKLPNEKVTAVAITGVGITFYEKGDDDYFKDKGSAPLIYSSGDVNPNIYGAVFSTDADSYKCNVRKAFERLEMLSRIYGKRMEEIQENEVYPEGSPCKALIEISKFYGATESLEEVGKVCKTSVDNCGGVGSLANEIEEINSFIAAHYECPVIY